MGKQKEPVFVNMHRGVVQVFNEDRRPVRVAPWANRNLGQDAIFEVEGEHYRQFVSAKGPLFPRPQGAESAAPAPDKGPAAGGKKVSGDKTPAPNAGGEKTQTQDPKDPKPPEVTGSPKDPKDPKPPEVPKDLSGYTVEGAVEQIAVTKDTKLLAAWVAAEVKEDNRKGVKEAIEKRLAELAK
jgi:hypothetical protein